MKIFKLDYNSQVFEEISTKQYLNYISQFNREIESHKPKTRKEYYTINKQNDKNSEQVLRIFEEYNVVFVYHFDSESDIYVTINK